MRVMLIAANGQLGSDLSALLANKVDLRALTHAEIEIRDSASITAALDRHMPDLVMNTAAYNRVDDAEDEFDEALGVNAVGPHLLARACATADKTLLHVSTDYVFDGEVPRPRREDEWPRPRTAYGISKRAGELAVLASCPRSYVVRTSGLYGPAGSRGKGGNFVETMLRLAERGGPIRVVEDQVVGPTYTADLAEKIAELILRPAPWGIYHVTAAGQTTWFEFARAIFELAGVTADLRPQTTAESGARARRPAYSVLANEALAAAGLSQIRPWREGLRAYLEARTARQRDSRTA